MKAKVGLTQCISSIALLLSQTKLLVQCTPPAPPTIWHRWYNLPNSTSLLCVQGSYGTVYLGIGTYIHHPLAKWHLLVLLVLPAANP